MHNHWFISNLNTISPSPLSHACKRIKRFGSGMKNHKVWIIQSQWFFVHILFNAEPTNWWSHNLWKKKKMSWQNVVYSTGLLGFQQEQCCSINTIVLNSRMTTQIFSFYNVFLTEKLYFLPQILSLYSWLLTKNQPLCGKNGFNFFSHLIDEMH